MLFLSEPPQTQYDLRFHVFGVPIRVHPLFWVLTAAFGLSGAESGDGRENLIRLLTWVGAVFLSILIHELGHAFAMRFYGERARVVLYAMGGITIPEASVWNVNRSSRARNAWSQIVISAAGPVAGFLLAGVVLGIVVALGGAVRLVLVGGVLPLPVAVLPPAVDWYWHEAVFDLMWVSVSWGCVNLLPVYPLDGGEIARTLLVRHDPWHGTARCLWLSVIVGAVVAIGGAAILHSIFLAVLFGSLALSNYQALQQSGGRW